MTTDADVRAVAPPAEPPTGASPLFRAFVTTAGGNIPFYLIESTAPNNVDDGSLDPKIQQEYEAKGLQLIDDPNLAIEAIAERLTPSVHDSAESYPNLVVMVHGYNSPPPSALELFSAAAEFVVNDKEGIAKHGDKLVCVGYRWPSEGVPRPLLTSWQALPTALKILLGVSVAILAGALARSYAPLLSWFYDLFGFLVPIAFAAVVVILVGIALRAIVYFRDNYRASSYGVPDLVEIIRQIDRQIVRNLKEAHALKGHKRVALSFIGHSMGGFVVTNVVRTLSDVFDPASIIRDLSGRRTPDTRVDGNEAQGVAKGVEGGVKMVSANIGHVFQLMRMVLVSPDIPGEALLAERANFLLSSLRRFDEAYLFSNEGDEVLRLISTAANYFSFPTKSADYGYRLGNVEVLSEKYGDVSGSVGPIEEYVRVGVNTIKELEEKITLAVNGDGPDKERPARAFSYFDCTDYVDDSVYPCGKKRSLLSFVLRDKLHNPKGAMTNWQHFLLLLRYLAPGKCFSINVHGGYFDGLTSRMLIYRLATLGVAETQKIVEGSGQDLSQLCEAKQIRYALARRETAARPLSAVVARAESSGAQPV